MTPTYVEISRLLGSHGYHARLVFGSGNVKSKRCDTYAEALEWVRKLTEPA